VGRSAAATELVDVKQTGWRGKKYRRRTKLKNGGESHGVRASKYAHLKEHGGNFGRFDKKTRVRGYPLFVDAVNSRQSKFVEKAFAKGQAKSRALAKKLITQGRV